MGADCGRIDQLEAVCNLFGVSYCQGALSYQAVQNRDGQLNRYLSSIIITIINWFSGGDLSAPVNSSQLWVFFFSNFVFCIWPFAFIWRDSNSVKGGDRGEDPGKRCGPDSNRRQPHSFWDQGNMCLVKCAIHSAQRIQNLEYYIAFMKEIQIWYRTDIVRENGSVGVTLNISDIRKERIHLSRHWQEFFWRQA